MQRLMRLRPLRAMTLALLVACTLVLAGCAAMRLVNAEPPKVSVSSLAFQGATLMEQRFLVGLRLQNPNDFALPVTGLEYTLHLDGNKLASGMTQTSVNIPSLGSETVEVTVISNLLDSLAQLRRWQQSPPDQLDYRIEGRLRVKGLPTRLPFSYSGQVGLGVR